jgi:hypothetical protein
MSEEAPKLRLKPRLLGDTPAASPTPSVPALPPMPETPATAPAPIASTAAEAPAEPAPKPKISLRPKADAPVAPSTSRPPPSAPAAPSPARPIPAALPLPAATVAETTPHPTSASRSPKKVQVAALVIGVAGLLIFSGVGFFAYRGFVAQKKADEEEARQEEREVKEARQAAARARAATIPTTASATVPSSPAETPPPKPSPTAAAPAPSSSAPPAKTTPPPAPAIEDRPAVAATNDGSGNGAPSPQFKTWVNGLKITGVRSGAVPRMMIGGLAYNLGDTVNHDLGVTFDSYDAGRHTIRFKDKSGATIERRDR